MKIVIDICEEDWKDINDIHFIREDLKFKIGKAIMKGTPLPKRHGRIIDESKINKVYAYKEEAIANNIKAINTMITGTDAPTIIEADKEGEE